MHNARATSTTGRWLALLAALLWSSSGFFVKSPWLAEMPAPALACWRALFAGLLLAPLVRRMQWSWWLPPMTAIFALMNYSYLTALAQGDAGKAIWLQSSSPIWVFLISTAVLGERADRRDWQMLLLGASGVAVILAFEARGGSWESTVYGLLSGVSYALVVLLLRRLRALDAIWLICLNHVVTALVLAPFLWDSPAWGAPLRAHAWPSGWQWLILACFGLFQMGTPYVLFSYAVKHIPSQEACLITLSEPVLMPVWVYLAWGVAPPPWVVVGGSLICLGLVLRYRPRSTKSPVHSANR